MRETRLHGPKGVETDPIGLPYLYPPARGWTQTPRWWHGATPYRPDAPAMNGVEPYSAVWRAGSPAMPNRCLEPTRCFPRSFLDGGLFIDATRGYISGLDPITWPSSSMHRQRRRRSQITNQQGTPKHHSKLSRGTRSPDLQQMNTRKVRPTNNLL